VYLTLAEAPSSDETLRRAELIRAHRRAGQVTRWLDAPVVGSSALAHLAWRTFVRSYERRIAGLRGGAPRDDVWSRIEPATTPAAIEEKRRGYMSFWENLIRFSDLITRRQGKLFFHFVQPNQYDRESKPLSEEERTLYTKNDWFDLVTSAYRSIESMTDELRAEGIESHFLGRVFAASPETVYMDDCCHLNDHGLDVLTTTIADRIIASGRLDEVPAAER
jgi:hypothetical protein